MTKKSIGLLRAGTPKFRRQQNLEFLVKTIISSSTGIQTQLARWINGTLQAEALPRNKFVGLAVKDRFGIPSRCEVHDINRARSTPMGRVAGRQWRSVDRPANKSNRHSSEASGNKVGRQLVQNLAGIAPNPSDSNTRSLLALRIVSLDGNTFGVELSLAGVF